jgi:hypothetical protein
MANEVTLRLSREEAVVFNAVEEINVRKALGVY